ncbi:MAG: leucine-rich repeat protein [Kiritimatiellae bacterium]|nr:leucine-rich repeat protein [Kiritimatiellia bacterium]MBQ2626135.1 leucine-rich repeat protein [Kiritimatiellia bacterium]
MNNDTVARLFAGALALMSVAGWAETESVNGVTWTYYTSYSYGATITGMEGTASDVTIPYMLGGYEVKRIGSDVFKGNSYLRRVTIPWYIREIGSDAFYSCVNLDEVKLSEGLERIGSEAFFGCQSLQSVEIPSSVNDIYSGAFAMCGIRRLTLNKCCPYRLSETLGGTTKLLTSLTLGAETDRSISQSFFDGCTALSSISIAATHAKYQVVNGLVLSKDGKELVAVPPGRSSISIPSTVTSLGWDVVKACSNLIDTVSIPGVKKLGDWVVGYDERNPPKSVNLQGVRAVRDYAFGDCDTLASLTIPASVKIIGENAFDGCYRLKTISVAKGNTAFKYTGGMLLTKNGKRLITVSRNVTSVAVPNGVQTIGYAAFAGCTRLTKVSLPKTVRHIGDEGANEAFYCWVDDDNIIGCPNLKLFTVASGNKRYKSKGGMLLEWDDWDNEGWGLAAVPPALVNVTIPQGTKWISWCAFRGCSKVTSVTIPASMTEFDHEGFEYLPRLKSFKVAAKNKYFKASKGLLLSKNGKKLVLVPNALTSVSVPSGVTRIEAYAFYNCEKLKTVKFPSSVVSMGRQSFPDRVCNYEAIPGLKLVNGFVIGIGNGFNEDWDGVLDLTGARGIADQAFNGTICSCGGSFGGGTLKTLVIPGTVRVVGMQAFAGNRALKRVAMKHGVTTISQESFKGCSSLSEVSIPDSVTSVGKDAFADCCAGDDGYWEWDDETEEEAWVPETNGLCDYDTIPGAATVDGWVVGGNLPHGDVEWDGSLDLTGARGIAAYAFGGDSAGNGISGSHCGDPYLPEAYSPGLVSVTIPATVKGIGAYAFGYCADLQQVTMPLSVRSRVASTAFKGCSKSLKITYLASVTFNANGGTVDGAATSRRSVALGTAVGTPPVPEREGYTFAGWWTAKTKGAKVTAKTAVKNDVTYYARWTTNKYTVSTPKSGGGTVKGTGRYNYGSTVTLTAKPDSKSLFAYWMRDGEIVGYRPSLSVKVGAANAGYTAVFRAKSSFTERPEQPWIAEWGDELRVGVAFKGLVEIDEACRPVKFKAESLPKGLSLDVTTGVISGVPTVAGNATVRITAASVAKPALVSAAEEFDDEVKPLDDWAKGTFNMKGTLGGKAATAVLTIGQTGKVSGKFVVAKKQYSFTAASYASRETYFDGSVAYLGKTSLKYGSKTYPLEFAVSLDAKGETVFAEMSAVNGAAEYGYVSVSGGRPKEKYAGGEFDFGETEFSRLEVEAGVTERVTVPLTRNEGAAAFAAKNTVVAVYPDGTQVTNVVEWSVGETSKTFTLDTSVLTRAGDRLLLMLLDGYGDPVAESHIAVVNPVPNSTRNPLWIGERTADTLAWGEWTMDLDVALEKAKDFNATNETERAYTLVLAEGALWCPDCLAAEVNFFSDQLFKDWAASNKIALVALDIPDNPERSGGVSLLSYETYRTADRYVTANGTPGYSNETLRVQSGAGYLSRHGISPEDAAAVAARNAHLVTHDTDDGGFMIPGETRSRIVVPTLLLLRDDGAVSSRFDAYSFGGPTEFDAYAIAILEGMLENSDAKEGLVAKPTEIAQSIHVEDSRMIIQLVQGETYCITGIDCENVSNWAVLFPVEREHFYAATRTGTFNLQLLSQDVSFQLWHPGTIGFEIESDSVEECNGTYNLRIARTGGSSGRVEAQVIFDEYSSPLFEDLFDLWDAELVWEEGEIGVKTVPIDIYDNPYADGDQILYFGLNIYGDSLPNTGATRFRLTLQDDDEPNPGRIAITQTAPAIADDMMVYAFAGSTVKVLVSREGGASGELAASLAASDGVLDKTGLTWRDRDDCGYVVYWTLPDEPGTATLTLLSESESLIDGERSVLTVNVLPQDSFGFEYDCYPMDAMRYVKIEDLRIPIEASTPLTSSSVKMIAGSLAPGLTWEFSRYGGLLISGVPTAAGSFKAAFRLFDGETGGLTTVVETNVIDPTVCGGGDDGTEPLNPSVATTRSFTDIPVISADGEHLAGTLTLILPRNGRASAKYRTACGNNTAVTLASPSWERGEMWGDGTLYATLTGIGGNESYALSVAAYADGDIYLEMYDSAFPDSILECINPMATWSSENPATDFMGMFDVSLTAGNAISGNPELAIGNGALTLRMTQSAVKNGMFNYSGVTPNGVRFSGSAVLTPVDWDDEQARCSRAVLPILWKSSSDLIAGLLVFAVQDGSSELLEDECSLVWRHFGETPEASCEIELHASSSVH